MAFALAFARIAELAHALGVGAINRLSGCWEHRIDEHWWVAVNGHSTATRESSGRVDVPPCTAYVEFNGLPAGIIGPSGGVIAAGAAANEATLIAALEAAIRRAGADPAEVPQ